MRNIKEILIKYSDYYRFVSRYNSMLDKESLNILSFSLFLPILISYFEKFETEKIYKNNIKDNNEKRRLYRLSDNITNESDNKNIDLNKLKEINRFGAIRNLIIKTEKVEFDYANCDFHKYSENEEGLEYKKIKELFLEYKETEEYRALLKKFIFKFIRNIGLSKSLKKHQNILFNQIIKILNNDNYNNILIVELINDLQEAILHLYNTKEFGLNVLSLKEIREKYPNIKYNTICNFCGNKILSTKNSINSYCSKNDINSCMNKKNKLTQRLKNKNSLKI